MELQNRIDELKVRVRETEEKYKQEEEDLRKSLGTELYLELKEAKFKLKREERELTIAQKNFDSWNNKLNDIKYRYKETGKGKEIYDEAISNVKNLNPRIIELKESIKVLVGVVEKINNNLQKRIGSKLKKLESKKMKIITALIKEIMSLEKKLEK